MGGSDSPLLQLLLILDSGEEAELSYGYFKKRQPLFKGQGGRKILVEVALVIMKHSSSLGHAFIL